MISFKKWKRAVTNELICEEQKKLFYKYETPESS